MIMEFIDTNRDDLGVEPICRVLQVDVLLGEVPPVVGAGGAGPGVDADPVGVVEGELFGLRGPQALEGGTACWS